MKYIKLIIGIAFIAIIVHCKLYSDKVKEAQREQNRLESEGLSKDSAHYKAFVDAGLIEK